MRPRSASALIARASGAALFLAFLCWCGLALILDRYGQRALPDQTWDAIIVAGCRVEPDGTPSPALRNRTELAVAHYERGSAPLLLFTGGTGSFPPSEAEAAAQHARQLGVPDSAILLEDSSTSTEENARNSAAGHPLRRVLVVSDSYHIFRAGRVFDRHFEQVDTDGSLAPLWPRVRGAMREVLAVCWYAIRGRL